MKFHKVSSSARSRCFSLTSYLNEAQIRLVLVSHQHQVRAFAFALHDKDVYTEEDRAGELKEKHYHIIIVTYNATTLSAVRRWFYGWNDDNGNMINTLGQICYDKYSAYDYLTHSDPKSIQEGKYLYSKDIIISNDYGHFTGHSTSDYDNSQLIITDMMNGVPYEILWKKYGRDFIINFDKYRYFCEHLSIYEKFDLENEFCVNARISRELKINLLED